MVTPNDVVLEASQLQSNVLASGDPLALTNSDHPGAQIVSLQLTGLNFLNWSRNVKMALGAKCKLGFIDGSCKKPGLESSHHQRRLRADYMVRCWILNSIGNSIAETLMYVESAKQLWDELVERFGQTNGPLLYQLRRTLASLEQGNKSVGEYYGRLKKIWDEIGSIEGLPECECGILAQCKCSVRSKRFLTRNPERG